ncbi:MAG: hypothetical protein OXH15_11045 [Gammaproteobacteria bacterium]|nr:hypothetical protein [Gammaproteobacteria bacterium]
MPLILGLALGLLATVASAREVDDACANFPEFRAAAIFDFGDHVWSALGDLRTMEPSCRGTDSEWPYRTTRGQLESFVLNHRAALQHFDRSPPAGAAGDLPDNTNAVPAVPYIAKRAASHRFVIVNERHHASSDRLLTMSLLEPLRDQGFRYLAAEGVWQADTLRDRGYPISNTGYYVKDVVFAAMIRQALALGYAVVGYEHEAGQLPAEGMNAQQTRDYWQAHNLIARTIARDETGKVLVHCGYAHAYESRSDRWTPMAHYLRQAAGIDPLTVDQTQLSERGTPANEDPVRRAAAERGFVSGEPIVLVDDAGALVPIDGPSVDIRVVGLRTDYEAGRPTWMRMGGLREPLVVDVPECAAEPCILEAVDSEQPDAVAYDRAEATSASVVLFLPSDRDVQLATYSLSGQLRRTWRLPTGDR